MRSNLPEWLQVLVDHVKVIDQNGLFGLCIREPLVESRRWISRVSLAILSLRGLERLGLLVDKTIKILLGFADDQFDGVMRTLIRQFRPWYARQGRRVTTQRRVLYER